MSNGNVEIVVRGEDAAQAADAVALGLMAAGASVDFPERVHRNVPDGQTLRGVHAVVRLARAGNVDLPAAPGRPVLDLASVAKIGIGLVLLLMLLGAEVRLRFGLRLDTIVTLIGVWAFWHYCLRPENETA